MTTDVEREIARILIGESEAMGQLRATIIRYAPTNIPVLIIGPTGAGKELVAHAIHLASRRSGAFVPFNVCAIPESMFEDTLFGHVKGAFTGAVGDTKGYFREANGGTMLLDEISGLPLMAQIKLLRAVETGTVRPTGATMDYTSDVRVLCASNEDLNLLAASGRFRADLLHRISGAVVRVPSLAARRDDIPLLVEHLASSAPRSPLQLSRPAIAAMQRHEWPGNVRELRSVVARLKVHANGGEVSSRDVTEAIGHAGTWSTGGDSGARNELLELLNCCGHDPHAVARRVGLHVSTIYRKMERLGIPRRRRAWHDGLGGPAGGRA